MKESDPITSQQLAERWGMHPGSLTNWRTEGKGPPFIRPTGGPRGPVFYSLADVLAWEQAHRYTSNAAQFVAERRAS